MWETRTGKLLQTYDIGVNNRTHGIKSSANGLYAIVAAPDGVRLLGLPK